MQKKDEEDKFVLDRKAFIRKSSNVKEGYDIVSRPISSGSYGEVHVCTHRITREKRAVKIIPKFKMTNIENFLNEIELMKLVVIFK